MFFCSTNVENPYLSPRSCPLALSRRRGTSIQTVSSTRNFTLSLVEQNERRSSCCCCYLLAHHVWSVRLYPSVRRSTSLLPTEGSCNDNDIMLRCDSSPAGTRWDVREGDLGHGSVPPDPRPNGSRTYQYQQILVTLT